MTTTAATDHVCFTYLFAYLTVCPRIRSPAPKMRSVAQIRCVCGASVQSMPPKEQREPSVRVRATAGRTSAVPFNEVSSTVTLSKTDPENKTYFDPTYFFSTYKLRSK